jgi:gamma-glutamylcyclotransferase (GGCT)/AIG2-like uncharacterized protein YtfP
MNLNQLIDSNIYFAYGSNLCPDQMAVRCPDHEILSTAILHDYQLCFPRSATFRNGGVAGIRPQQDSKVWGVVYRMSDTDIIHLDKIEDLGICYNKAKISVQVSQGLIEAFSYVAIDEKGTHLPTRTYLDIILKGLNSRATEIPKEYIDYVASFQTL